MTDRGAADGPLRIGLLAPPWVTVPPTTYGGTEVVIDNLARGLAERGHDVTLVTVGGSTCPVPQVRLSDRPVAPMGESAPEAAHVLAGLDALGDVDVVHDHTVLGALLARLRPRPAPPLVTTNHNLFSPALQRVLLAAADETAVVAISRSHAAHAGQVPVAAVVPHGIDLDLYHPGPGDGGYLLFIGRMSADKGVHRAVRIARAAGMPLVIVAKMRDPTEREYYDRDVRPLLDPGAPEPAERPLAERVDLLRHATALLNPISWPEPFGLVMAEALACGTPVLARPFGSAPEVVSDGVTGYLARTDDDAVARVRELGSIDRAACRRRAEALFARDRMVTAYERLYRARVRDPRGPGPPGGRAGLGGRAHAPATTERPVAWAVP